MSRRQKLTILGGVILVLLFCCSGLAGRVPQGIFKLRLNLQAPSAAWLRSRLTEKLHGGDLQLRAGAEAGCAVQGDQLIVPPGAHCEFAIPASPNRTRQLGLALQSDGSRGDSVAIRLNQNPDQQNPMTVEQTLQKGGDRLSLDVYSNKAKREAQLILQDCSLGKDYKQPGEGALAGCAVEIRN